MFAAQPNFRSQLLQAANAIPWSLLDVVGAFPEASGNHSIEGEWSIRDQVLHLQNVELRYTIPNLKALPSGGALVPFGDDDREPDEGGSLDDLAGRLASLYNDRVSLLRQVLPAAWSRSLTGGEGTPVNAEAILTEECVQHDAEHLSQLLGTFADWQATVAKPGQHREGVDLRATLLSAAVSASETLLGFLGVIDDDCASYQPEKEGEWCIKEQLRHLLYVDRRFTMPNVRAILDGGPYVPYNATAGVDDLEPDGGESVDDLRRALKATYDERNALFLSVPPGRWLDSITDDDGDQVSVEFLIVHECVRHDNEHLSQLLSNARQYRLRTGEALL